MIPRLSWGLISHISYHKQALSLIPSSASQYPCRRPFAPRFYAAQPSKEDLNVSHSQFLHSASPQADWKSGKHDTKPSEDELEGVTEGMGKILPTSSHLFKLILPLKNLPRATGYRDLPLVVLIHPAQPLSHVSRLIISSINKSRNPPDISYQGTLHPESNKDAYQWSDSTDVGDFIRDAARAAKFRIQFMYEDNPEPYTINVRVPTFADRTVFLRRRLSIVKAQLASMEDLKRECDRDAHRGARRMAVTGFGALVVYWGGVARLTFWDYGWDVMEPITYLSGLSMVILSYLWFLYQGREVSYSSVLDRSVSTRREALYRSRGMDIEKWGDLISERRALMKEIARIAEDYDQGEGGESGEEKEKESSQKDSSSDK